MQNFPRKKRSTYKFAPDLVKEYGEQTFRDHRSRNQSYKDVAWSSVFVAEACGYITEKEIHHFHRAIVRYARITKFSNNFI